MRQVARRSEDCGAPLSIGRRTAIEPTAHLFLELSERLRLVGLAADNGFAFPLIRYLLADAFGLSAIHVNRVLWQLCDPVRLLAAAERFGLEGIVSKRKAAPYVSGERSGWLKVKTRTWLAANREQVAGFRVIHGRLGRTQSNFAIGSHAMRRRALCERST